MSRSSEWIWTILIIHSQKTSFNLLRGGFTLNNQQTINLPDWLFIQFCKETYGINRGILNTIDRWFYSNGMENIHERRKAMLEFLQHSIRPLNPNGENSKVKIGRGNLTGLLKEYLEKTRHREEIIKNFFVNCLS